MSKSTSTIREAWLSYMDEIVPKDAPSTQLQESKRAFVAGAFHVLNVLTAIGDDSVTEDEGVTVIEQLHQECETFVKDVLEGRA